MPGHVSAYVSACQAAPAYVSLRPDSCTASSCLVEASARFVQGPRRARRLTAAACGHFCSCGLASARAHICCKKCTARNRVVLCQTDPGNSIGTQGVQQAQSGASNASEAHDRNGSNHESASAERANEPLQQRRQRAESTDAVSSALTRRFGLAGGLAWVAFLAIGTLGEQVKTRLEVRSDERNTTDVTNQPTVELDDGVEYVDLRVGGGSAPRKGDLVVLDLRGSVNGEVFEDTSARKKPIVYPFKSRPFTGGMNAGLEEVIASMRAGGKRKCTIPPQLGFGDQTYSLRATLHAGDKDATVPPSSTLQYEVSLVRVSPPPT